MHADEIHHAKTVETELLPGIYQPYAHDLHGQTIVLFVL